MKKFIIKFILISVIVTILCLLISTVIKKNIYGRIIVKYDNIPEKIDVANLGSSHGFYGFNYDGFEQQSFNFANQGQRLSYDYLILENYISKFEKNSILFIPISYFSFSGIDEIERDDFESKNRQYYFMLDPQYIKNYSFSEDIILNYLLILKSDYNFVSEIIDNKDTVQQFWSSKSQKNTAESCSAEAYQRHFSEEGYGGKLNPNEITALTKIIELCKKNNIEPILVTTPYIREYNDLISDSQLCEFESIINEFTNQGVKYLNYSDDIRFTDRYELFADCDHLNYDGAKKFTEILFSEVIQN